MAFTTYPGGDIGGSSNWARTVLEQGGGETDSEYAARLAQFGGYNQLATTVNSPDILSTGAWDYSPSPNGTPVSQESVGTYSFEGQNGLTEKQYQEAYQKAIDDSYNSVMGRLNKQEDNLYDNEPNFYNIATAPYTSQIPLVQQAGQEGESALGLQQQKAGLNEQNALAAARRLYDELTSRNRQAFGSGALGSVGQAASEILGRTAQQGMGSIRNQAAETYNNIATAVVNLKAKVKAQLDSLELQKNQALSQAKIAFQEKIDYINEKKNEAAQAKAQNKLDAMREYRDYVRSIEQQATQLSNSITNQANSVYGDLVDQTTALKSNVAGSVNTGISAVGNQGVQNAGAYNSMGQGNALSASSQQSTLDSLYGNITAKKPEDVPSIFAPLGSSTYLNR
jgi:hypothetical protein